MWFGFRPSKVQRSPLFCVFCKEIYTCYLSSTILKRFCLFQMRSLCTLSRTSWVSRCLPSARLGGHCGDGGRDEDRRHGPRVQRHSRQRPTATVGHRPHSALLQCVEEDCTSAAFHPTQAPPGERPPELCVPQSSRETNQVLGLVGGSSHSRPRLRPGYWLQR